MNAAQQMKFNIYGNVQVFQVTPEHLPVFPFTEDELLGGITLLKPEITYNTNRTDKRGRKAPDGIEIRFGSARPTETTRQVLKDHGFQFSERQTIWYALDNELSRTLTQRWTNEEAEVDTTQYIKQHFWARVRSGREYDQLRDYTEFFVKSQPPKNFNTKKALERAAIVDDLINEGILFFKKFYNRPVDEDDQQPNDAEPPDGITIANRLQAQAEGMQKAIDEKFNSATSRQRPTNRRNRIVEGQEAEGRVLLRTQQVLYALAGAHRSGRIGEFPLLENIRTKSQVSMLNLLERSTEGNWRESWAADTFTSRQEDFSRIGIDSFADWQAAEKQKQAILQEFSADVYRQQDEQQNIRAMEREVWERDIPGFFPTPRPLIERMLQLADVALHHTVLEPSAGKGDILDAVAALFPGKNPSLYACEINHTLREILVLKGYTLYGSDFMQTIPGNGLFDRILMNPPFENGQDADHVTHALKLLKPGGRLVAIVSEGLFFRTNKKERAFRQMLRQKNAYVSEPVDGAFNNAFNRANVRVRFIAINEDGSHLPFLSAGWERPGLDDQRQEDNTETETAGDDTRMLELEAEAELELLRMRVEAERRKRGRSMNGIDVRNNRLQELRQKAWAMNRWQELDFK